MTEIVLITTNRIKLAHFRHLCQAYDVNIIRHKQLNYGIGYDEPRVLDREELLTLSIKDAIKRWEKNISQSGKKLFFIEDTSVRIECLSTEELDVPGVDIKYWMQDNDFESLDSKLKMSDNNRKATVFSHIVLALPKDLKEKFGLEFKIFTSYTEGKIASEEFFFESNIIYPWLDNKSFNKWFVPNGFDLPLGMLNIDDADKVDFRKTALEEMLLFLKENKKISNSKKYMPSFIFNPFFIVTGSTCSGKTTIGKFLLENYNYFHIEASDFMQLSYFETLGTESKVSINEYAESKLKDDPNVVVKKIINLIRDIPEHFNKFIITGFRTQNEILFFKKNLPYSYYPSEIKIINLETEFDIRFDRWKARKREKNNDYTLKRFTEINELQNRIGVSEIKKLENIEICYNNSSFEDLYNSFREKYLKELDTENINLDFLSSSSNKLEELILLVLAEKYINYPELYLTTTEIAHAINASFKYLASDKHKDNVSRYFNQKFYPYYQIINDKKNRYKLSPTGYSKAVALLRSNNH
jgi:adenylate kinase family enzyme/inosine/xanthosine triphosphate pyrophosphatase family protein